jgi:glycosyltransferase involved in cell wall biosynthesis
MIKVLSLSYKIPYPPRDGYDTRVINLLEQLSDSADITLLCRALTPISDEQNHEFLKKHIQIETVFIERGNQIARLSKGLFFFFGLYPVASAGWYFRAFRKKLQFLLKNHRWDIIIVDGSWLGVYWPLIHRSGTTTVVVFHNLEYELLQRMARTTSSGLRTLLYLHDAFKMKFKEGQLIRQASLAIVPSDRERTLLSAKWPLSNVVVVPNCVDTVRIASLVDAGGQDVLFVGSLDYLPNQDAVLYFVADILPLLQAEFSKLTFTIVGRGAPAGIKGLSDRPGVRIFSSVTAVKDFYRSALLCVAPLRCGGGTRLKILEAMAYGRAVVSTSIGCEGLQVENNTNIIVADHKQQFADAIKLLLQNPGIRARLAREGRSLVEREYSSRSVGARYAALVKHVARHKPHGVEPSSVRSGQPE